MELESSERRGLEKIAELEELLGIEEKPHVAVYYPQDGCIYIGPEFKNISREIKNLYGDQATGHVVFKLPDNYAVVETGNRT